MQFLIGLDDCYQPVRSSLLTRDPLPEVKDAYNVVSKEESHRGVPESFGVTESKQNATSFVAKTFNNNRRYKIGIDRCFEIVGFPQGFKRNSNTGKQTFNANANVKMNDKPFSSLSSGFTPEQMQKVLIMINDKPYGSIHANMVCRASFFNGKSNVVMCFHVSKLLRHNRLGHPADQVLYMLKNDLSISDNSSVPMCEVCKRAKQTREPFPLSDHKSKTLRKLVHLDLWGPYRVHSREVEDGNFPYSDNFDSTQGRYQSGRHSATQVDDQNWSEGNLQNFVPSTSQSSPTQINDEVQTLVLRRFDRHSKPPVKLNDYVLNSNMKYGIERYVNYFKLNSVNLCFATSLNKSIEPFYLSEAMSDPN
ncbi:hypothetical protein Tco_1266548 [Tanacetum coccineum]